jgi:hypothetical protein
LIYILTYDYFLDGYVTKIMLQYDSLSANNEITAIFRQDGGKSGNPSPQLLYCRCLTTPDRKSSNKDLDDTSEFDTVKDNNDSVNVRHLEKGHDSTDSIDQLQEHSKNLIQEEKESNFDDTLDATITDIKTGADPLCNLLSSTEADYQEIVKAATEMFTQKPVLDNLQPAEFSGHNASKDAMSDVDTEQMVLENDDVQYAAVATIEEERYEEEEIKEEGIDNVREDLDEIIQSQKEIISRCV